MWYKQGAGDFVLHKQHSCIEFFAQESVLVGLVLVGIDYYNIHWKHQRQVDKFLHQTGRQEVVFQATATYPGFGWIDVPGFFHVIFDSTHRTVDLLFWSLVGSKYVQSLCEMQLLILSSRLIKQRLCLPK